MSSLNFIIVSPNNTWIYEKIEEKLTDVKLYKPQRPEETVGNHAQQAEFMQKCQNIIIVVSSIVQN